MNVAMLPVHQGIALQVAHVVIGRLWIELEKEPADVGVEKTFGDIVGIFLVVGVLVVPPMFARPHEDGVFESARTEEQHEQAKWPFPLVGFVREKAVIAGGDTESGECDQHEKHSCLEPVEIEEPKVNRQTGHREKGRSDEERTGEPIDAVSRKGEDLQNADLLVWKRSARQYDILLRPVVDLAAMRTGQPRTFQFCFAPQSFLNRLASRRQLPGRRAAHENAFDHRSIGRFDRTGEIEVVHPSR